MTVAEIIEKLSKYDENARVLDFDDVDYMISNIFYDPETDEIYVEFDTAE